MITIIFIAIASACNATIDTLQFHYDKSVFPKQFPKRQFWDPYYSWKNKYNAITLKIIKWWMFDKPVCLTDAWHLFKTIQIFFIIFAAVSYKTIVNPIIDIIILGTIWNCIFSLFFNKLLVKK